MTTTMTRLNIVVGVLVSLWLPVPCASGMVTTGTCGTNGLLGAGITGSCRSTTGGRTRSTGTTRRSVVWLTASSSSSSSSQDEQPLLFLPSNYQSIGEMLIREAGKQCGAHDLNIEWKKDKIKVVVQGDAFVSNPKDDEVDESIILEVDDDDYDNDDDDDDDLEVDLKDDNDDDDMDETLVDDLMMFDSILPVPDDDIDDGINDEQGQVSKGVDVGELARAINAALDKDSVGFIIAEKHEIEVTTPGAPDELSGIMWQVYQGFDVICQHQDPKTKNIKTIEGRLHDRTEEFTVINIKGRMKKLKNIDVLSVKLPKAKKEKGGV